MKCISLAAIDELEDGVDLTTSKSVVFRDALFICSRELGICLMSRKDEIAVSRMFYAGFNEYISSTFKNGLNFYTVNGYLNKRLINSRIIEYFNLLTFAEFIVSLNGVEVS